MVLKGSLWELRSSIFRYMNPDFTKKIQWMIIPAPLPIPGLTAFPNQSKGYSLPIPGLQCKFPLVPQHLSLLLFKKVFAMMPLGQMSEEVSGTDEVFS